MPTRNTTSQLTDSQGNNRTATHLSTNIIIKVPESGVVGAIQSLNITESRPIKMIGEVSNDGWIDSAPNGNSTYTGRIQRVRFDRMRLFEAFGRGFIHIHSQRIPFDIEIHDVFHDADPSNAIITTLKNVWFKSLSYDYTVSDYIIQENADFECERIYSIINNKNVAQSVANGRSNPIILNAFEQEADRGAFTGALDAAGLLNAFISDPRN